MHHLKGSPAIVTLQGAYEDKHNVHLIMELCSGGELFDRIVAKGHLSEKDAATLMRTIVSVVAHCHSLGVIHRDLKPEVSAKRRWRGGHVGDIAKRAHNNKARLSTSPSHPHPHPLFFRTSSSPPPTTMPR
jgi:hypothetical protein